MGHYSLLAPTYMSTVRRTSPSTPQLVLFFHFPTNNILLLLVAEEGTLHTLQDWILSTNDETNVLGGKKQLYEKNLKKSTFKLLIIYHLFTQH